MKKPAFLFLIIFIISFNCLPSYCQTYYSLKDIAVLADKMSETIIIARDDIYIAEQEKKRALSVLIPKISAYGNLTRYKNADISAPNILTGGVQLTQSFTINGKELIALNVTKKNIDAKTFSLEKIRSQYLLQVAQAYFNILSAQKFLEIAQSDIRRLTAHKDAVKEKLNVGTVTKTDLYRAQAELSKALTQQVISENRVLQSKAALHNLVIIDTDFNLEKDNFKTLKNYECLLDDITTKALKNRAEIKEAEINVDIARKTIKFQKSDFWPYLSLEAGYRETESEYDHLSKKVNNNTDDTYFTGQLVFTLFDGGLRKAQVNQAAADLRKAENALSLQKKQILLEAEVNYLDSMTAKKALLNLQDEIKSAKENFNAVQMQFKYGMADSIDIMDANTLFVSAQRRISDAEYVYYLSILKILYTKGELTGFLLSGT